MSQAPDIATNDSVTLLEESQETPSLTGGGTGSKRSPTTAHEKLSAGCIIVERPGRDKGSWERWIFCPDRVPEILSQEITLPHHCERIICLPSSALFAWPLWVASEGDSLELVLLELSGRHLLKRGMKESLVTLPVHKEEDRQLLLAVAPDEPISDEIMPANWERATRFELPARFLEGSVNHDLILWEEWESLQMAFYRDQKPIWFCGVRSHDLKGLIHRISLRLIAEGALEHAPSTILLLGFQQTIADQYTDSLARLFPNATITRSEAGKILPQLPPAHVDIPPTAARDERRHARQRQKLFTFAIVGVILYFLILLWGSGDLLIRQTALKRIRREIASIEKPALDAQQQSSRWHLLRPVIDPDTYPLDLLAAVAAPTEGGKARLTLFSIEQGHLHISGEASDVTQAYSVIEQLKKNPLLQQYDWSVTQPQLAGKNSVKFDMEGIRPDASEKTNTP